MIALPPPRPPVARQRAATVKVHADFLPMERAKLLKALTLQLVRASFPEEDAARILRGALHASSASGSGFVLTAGSEPVIVTNSHVANAFTHVSVSFGEHITIDKCPVKYRDPLSDIAVIGLPPQDERPAFVMPEAAIMADDTAVENTKVEATGYPGMDLGEESRQVFTLSTGTILNARVQLSEIVPSIQLLSHNARIDRGSSGGPLFVAGTMKVLGVNLATLSSQTSDGIMLAVPIDRIKPAFKENKEIETSFIEDCSAVLDELVTLGNPAPSVLKLVTPKLALEAALELQIRNVAAETREAEESVDRLCDGDSNCADKYLSLLVNAARARVSLNHDIQDLQGAALGYYFNVIRAHGGSWARDPKSYCEKAATQTGAHLLKETSHVRVRATASNGACTLFFVSEQGSWHLDEIACM